MSEHEWVAVEVTTVRRDIIHHVPTRFVVTMYHTRDCVDDYERWQADEERYTKRWPNYCRTCKGCGAFVYEDDPSPPGVALAPGSMTHSDPCPDCTERGRCARCGGRIDVASNQACPRCGWDWGRGVDDALPPPPECYCHLYQRRPEGETLREPLTGEELEAFEQRELVEV